VHGGRGTSAIAENENSAAAGSCLLEKRKHLGNWLLAETRNSGR
jgi:hypothetical protein